MSINCLIYQLIYGHIIPPFLALRQLFPKKNIQFNCFFEFVIDKEIYILYNKGVFLKGGKTLYKKGGEKMKMSFENAKNLLDKIDHLKFVNINNDNYWKYISLHKDLWWDIYFAEVLENEYVEIGKNLCERLKKLEVI